MKPRPQSILVGLILFSTLSPQLSTALAQVPSAISYQGRVQVSGTNFTGTGQFKFALVSPGTNTSRQATATATLTSGFITGISVTDGGAGYASAPVVTITDSTGSGATAMAQVSGGAVTNIMVQNAGSGYTAPAVTIAPPPPNFVSGTFWSNDETSNAGSEPASAVAVPVQQGLFTVFLGDTNLPNMQPVPLSVFTRADTRLRTWFSERVSGFTLLSPDQPLGSVGYAMMAAQVPPGAVSATGLADNAVTTEKLATNSVTSERIEDGTILASDLNSNLLNGTFWKLGGNGGTSAGLNFVGTTDNQPLEMRVQGRRALRLEPATNANPFYAFSPNVIGGYEGNSIAPGVIGATIAGGGRFEAGGSGDLSHHITAHHGTIGGGDRNTVNGEDGTIAGGGGNVCSGGYSIAGGGLFNTIETNAFNATLAGGLRNIIQSSAYQAVIGGGNANVVQGSASGILGGYQNTVQSTESAIGGGRGNIIDPSGSDSVIGGGYFNQIHSDKCIIGGGDVNFIQSSASYSSIGGGYFNQIQPGSQYSVIGGGIEHVIEAGAVTISGGLNNSVRSNASAATISGGSGNVIQLGANDSTIGGGFVNMCAGSGSTVPGGDHNNANGDYSFAAGRQAKANHDGAFVWADSTAADFASQRANQFRARALGGTRFDVNSNNWVEIYTKVTGLPPITITKVIDTSTGAYLSGGGAWTDNSDRDRKKDFAAVDPQKILAQVATLPVQSWSYTNETGVHHIGPMAQDFRAAFGVGADDKAIATLDECGVALAAIQGLNRKLEEQLERKDEEIAELRRSLADVVIAIKGQLQK